MGPALVPPEIVVGDAIATEKRGRRGRPPTGAAPYAAGIVRLALLRIERSAERTGRGYWAKGSWVSSRAELLEQILRSPESRKVDSTHGVKWAKATLERNLTAWGRRKLEAYDRAARAALYAAVVEGRLDASLAERMSLRRRPLAPETLRRAAEEESGGFTSTGLEPGSAEAGKGPAIYELELEVEGLVVAVLGLPPRFDDPTDPFERKDPMKWDRWRTIATAGVKSQIARVKDALGRLEVELDEGLFRETVAIPERPSGEVRRRRTPPKRPSRS